MSARHRVRVAEILETRNYYADRNRFKLAPPPQWWLRALMEFDTSLVVIPSRLEAVYWVAQVRRPDDLIQAKDIISVDEMMMRQYGLVPVTKLLSLTGQWNWDTHIFQRLKARAGWRNGLTPAETAQAFDAVDAMVKAKRHADRDDRLDSQIRWSEQVAKWHTGRKILAPGKPQTKTETMANTVADKIIKRARLAQRASSEPSTGRTQLATP